MAAVENESVIPASDEAAPGQLRPSIGAQRIFKIPSIHTAQPCGICTHLDSNRITGKILLRFYFIKKSMASGCPTCSLLYQVVMSLKSAECSNHTVRVLSTYYEHPIDHYRRWLVEDEGEDPRTLINIHAITLSRTQRGSLSILLEPFRDPHPWLLHLFSEIGEPSPWQVVQQDPFVRRNLETATKWIKDQMKTAVGSPLTPLPTRIIEIDTSYRVRLKLCTPEEEAHYACLSYCWGKTSQKHLQTTKCTLTQYRSGIRWSLLPQTFQDALILTQKLGLKYLWIDSLCIIQDDPEDWRTEGSNMATIYANSYITIAATNSASPQEGLCSSMPADDLCVVQTPDGQFKLRVHEGLNFMPYNGSMPLAKRAWFFQEHVLAPRVVHFATDELFWEDAQTISCECSGTNHLQDSAYAEYHVKPYQLIEANAEARAWWWRCAVKTYTGLQLTYESDIFPALQGIAHIMQQSKRCKYYAGLWEDTFIQDMLWYCPLAGSRPQTFRAPTWSWASVVAQVAYNKEEIRIKTCASVESVTVTAAGSSPLGQLRQASVTIRGPAFFASGNTVDYGTTRARSSYDLILQRGHECVMWAPTTWHPDVKNGQNDGEMLIMRMQDGETRFRKVSLFVVFRRSGNDVRTFERVGLLIVCDRRIDEIVAFEEMEITVV